MKLIVVVLAVGCMVSLCKANTNAIGPKFVKSQAKFKPPSHGVSIIDKCGCHEIVAKLKKVESNLLKPILNLRNKFDSVYSELLNIKKYVKSVSWFVGQTAGGQNIIGQLLISWNSLAQIMHSIRDLTTVQQRLLTKTLLTESILGIEKRYAEYKPPALEGDIVYTSCDDERITETGTYLVTDAFGEPTKVVCVLDFQPGAYTVIQNRQDGSTDFYRGYSDYRAGFGEFDGGDYWLGLDRIHNITSSGDYELFILLEDFEKNVTFARYDNFAIGSGDDFYPITKLDGFSGPAGDSYGSAVGVLFSTYDLDLDNSESNCAVSNRGAWWYTDCGQSNLNGLYLKGLSGGTTGMFWETFRGANYSLKRSRMMVKRKQEITTTPGVTTTTMAVETTTMAVETTTVAAETTTVAAETTTVTPETTTVAAETTTVAAETTTVAAETTTMAAETTTVAAETTTVAPETTTMAPETTTMAAETTTIAVTEMTPINGMTAPTTDPTI
uniref:fibrinogen C domain-containing protein precursor n=1 Tax=Anopheles funestus TaxID=62324 RepID=UPI0023D8856C|nr:fibrinogen C domain-containing protein precursor [Anopheles funestus]